MSRIYMILGKSACGKDHIYRALKEDKTLDLKPLILYTTRPKRRGEKDGREYYFTDMKNLEKMRAEGKIIEERIYHTIHGSWYYFTVNDAQLRKDKNYITIGTPQSLVKMKKHLKNSAITPIYVQSDPFLRLQRAIGRERKQAKPEYKEVCRRFLADEEDFSEKNLAKAGVDKMFLNNGELIDCINTIKKYILNNMKEQI